jgi:prepilin-type N-terminal cleavage/methylation domain-containing protein
MKTPNNHSQGFTLIELLVALSILTVGICALLMSHAGIMQSNTRSTVRSTAMVELENLMERGMAIAKMRYPNGVSGYDSLWTMGVGGEVVNDDIMGIHRRLVIEEVVGTRNTSGTILMSGTVAWTVGIRSDSLNARIRLTRHD